MSEAMSPLPDQDQKVAAIGASSMKKPAISRFSRARKTRVLVLGAGMSGLACARELQQRGYRVLVVEARDRPGGRLKGGVKTNDKEGGNEGMKTLPNSIVSPDNVDVKLASKSRNKKETTTPIDLGGALIHGIDSNPIYALTQQMGIPTKAVSECLLFDETGWPVDTKEDEKISTIFNECLEETFNRVATVDGTKDDAADAEDPGKLSADTTTSKEASSVSASATTAAAPAVVALEPANDLQGSDTSNNKQEQASRPQHEQPDEEDEEKPTTSSTDSENATFNEEKKEASERDGSTRQNGTVEEKETGTRMSTRQNGKPRADRITATNNSFVSRKRKASLSSASPPPSSKASSNEEINASNEAEAKKPASFGDVFDQVCEEKGAPMATPLFQWHQANLEVSCGASFPDLGNKWNDDEPYGYDGDHVAVKTSWKPIMECMAEGIDVLYQNPIKKVVLVVPDLPSEQPPEPEPEANTSQATLQSPEQNVASVESTPQAPASLPTSRKRRNRPSTAASAPLPSRKSRRLAGDDPTARRSTRANKGQKVDRFLVKEFSRGTYEENGSLGKHSSPRKRLQEPEKEDIHTTVQVTLEDGTVLEAEAVVCTLPLGILKLEDKPEVKPKTEAKAENAEVEEDDEDAQDESSGAIVFSPPLSEQKQTAIRRLGCGLLNKCVLSFSHVFWQDSDFLGLAHPANSYLVLNAARFTNKPILTFMYGGEFAKEIESWTDNDIVGDCMEVIRIISGKRDVPAPLDYAVTRWGHERYSRMSFSYVPPGVDGEEEFKAMSEAVYDPLAPKKPVIMFAGEHTTPFHPSTMHGAFLSGVREAYRLDLVVEAEANGNMEFDDEQLYQHTFGVRRLFPDARSPVARAPTQQQTSVPEQPNRNGLERSESQQSTSSDTARRRQHRRRGAASVMNLRQRPNNAESSVAEAAAPTKRRRPPQTEQGGRERGAGQNGKITPARRSRRSVYSMAEESGKKAQALGTTAILKKPPTTETEAELQQKKQIASLESRTLMRALESYGHNYRYIQSLVLPIFGSRVPPKSLPQVRARCQQLIRSIIASASAGIPKRIIASWVPKEVYIPPPPTPPGKKKKAKAATSNAAKTGKKPRAKISPKPAVEGTRKSSREQKQRQLMNL